MAEKNPRKAGRKKNYNVPTKELYVRVPEILYDDILASVKDASKMYEFNKKNLQN